MKKQVKLLLSNWKIWTSTKGFTLWETTCALFLFVLLQLLLLLLVRGQINYGNQLNQEYLDDWGSFAISLAREAQSAKLISCETQDLIIEDQEGRRLTYEYYENKDSQMIRKKVHGQGHQPMLMHVKHWQLLRINPHTVKLKALLNNGEKHQLYLIYQEVKHE